MYIYLHAYFCVCRCCCARKLARACASDRARAGLSINWTSGVRTTPAGRRRRDDIVHMSIRVPVRIIYTGTSLYCAEPCVAECVCWRAITLGRPDNAICAHTDSVTTPVYLGFGVRLPLLLLIISVIVVFRIQDGSSVRCVNTVWDRVGVLG